MAWNELPHALVFLDGQTLDSLPGHGQCDPTNDDSRYGLGIIASVEASGWRVSAVNDLSDAVDLLRFGDVQALVTELGERARHQLDVTAAAILGNDSDNRLVLPADVVYNGSFLIEWARLRDIPAALVDDDVLAPMHVRPDSVGIALPYTPLDQSMQRLGRWLVDIAGESIRDWY